MSSGDKGAMLIRRGLLKLNGAEVWKQPSDDRIAYLRLALGMCERLPSAHMFKGLTEWNGHAVADIYTRKKFLADLAVNGGFTSEQVRVDFMQI